MSGFEEIYETYFSEVFRYTRSLTLDEHRAEDITEETFFRAMKALPSFRGDCEIRIWLCHIAKNVWLSEKKREGRYDDGDEEKLSALPSGEDITDTLSDKDTALTLHRVLHGIGEPYREVFSLRVFGELSFGEIGSLFEKSEHWACVTYHRAKEKIQKEMYMNERN